MRQALVDAKDGDTIDATEVSGTITLTGGQMLVDKSVTINGAGADVLALDGNATSRVFPTVTGETVSISGLTIKNGKGGQGSGILNADSNSYAHADTNSNSHADTYANGYGNCSAHSDSYA